ncbi:MAG: hypothetical protein U9R23_01430 [Candidatus Cloacimonadota bacterium]|nr:hypothetical protein [Candidatus Cloacimonadota bacterium]
MHNIVYFISTDYSGVRKRALPIYREGELFANADMLKVRPPAGGLVSALRFCPV